MSFGDTIMEHQVPALAVRPVLHGEIIAKAPAKNLKEISGLTDAQTFGLCFGILGWLIYLNPTNPSPHYFLRVLRWWWVIIGIFALTGNFLGGPRGSAQMIGAALPLGGMAALALALLSMPEGLAASRKNAPYASRLGYGLGAGLRGYFWVLLGIIGVAIHIYRKYHDA